MRGKKNRPVLIGLVNYKNLRCTVTQFALKEALWLEYSVNTMVNIAHISSKYSVCHYASYTQIIHHRKVDVASITVRCFFDDHISIFCWG